MTVYRAAWVVPVDQPPIPDCDVRVEGGRIVGIGAGRASTSPTDGDDVVIDMGDVAIMPGLVNAHTHLELSFLRGKVPPANSFTDWVKGLFARRGRPDSAMTADMIAAVHEAVREVRQSGTVAVGDITNSLAAVDPMLDAGLRGVVFHELLGFKERDGALVESTREHRAAAAARGVRVSLAPHAPYSTSVELFKAIRVAVTESECPILSVHLGESAEEVELLASGSGPWRGMLETIGMWRHDWEIPRCGPVQFLDRHGVIDSRTLVVHGVQFDDAALTRLGELGATLVTCPRSNRWVGVGYPPIERFYRSGVPVAVGTDSLASVEDLNLFSELKTMRWLAPEISARQLLESATLVGARALGLEEEIGTLTPGKTADIIAVDLPRAMDDVEEYLVSGITPSQVTWLQ